jgi:hypothetical protein
MTGPKLAAVVRRATGERGARRVMRFQKLGSYRPLSKVMRPRVGR